MTFGSSLNLSLLTSQNISFAQVAVFGSLTKIFSLLPSPFTRYISYKKTTRVFSHIAGGALAYGLTRFLPIRTWIPHFPESLSWQVATATTFTLYLFSSFPLKKSLKTTPQTSLHNFPSSITEKKLQDAEQRSQSLVAEATELRKKLQASEQQLEQQLEHQRALIEQHSQSSAKQSALLEESQKNYERTQAEFKDLQKKFDALQKQYTELFRQSSQIKTKDKPALGTDKSTQAPPEMRMDLLQSELEAAQLTIESLEASEEFFRSEYKRAEQEIKELQNQYRTHFEREQIRHKSDIEKVQGYLDVADQQNRFLSNQMSKLQEELRSKQRQLEDQFEQLTVLHENMQGSENKNKDLEAKWQSSEKQRQSQLSQFEIALAQLEQKVVQLTEELAQERQKKSQS